MYFSSFAGDFALRAVISSVVVRLKMLRIMAGKHRKDSYAVGWFYCDDAPRAVFPFLVLWTSFYVPFLTTGPRCSASRLVWIRRTVALRSTENMGDGFTCFRLQRNAWTSVSHAVRQSTEAPGFHAFCMKVDLGSCGRFTSHWKSGLISLSPWRLLDVFLIFLSESVLRSRGRFCPVSGSS